MRVMAWGLLIVALLAAGSAATVVLAGLWLAAPARMAAGPVPASLPGAEAVQIASAWADRLLTPAFTLLLPPILGIDPHALRPIDRIGKVIAPVLVMSGTVDNRTPLDEAKALFGQAPEPKRFWAVEGARHVDLENYGPAAYWAEVLPFLTQNVQQRPALQDEPAEVAAGR